MKRPPPPGPQEVPKEMTMFLGSKAISHIDVNIHLYNICGYNIYIYIYIHIYIYNTLGMVSIMIDKD